MSCIAEHPIRVWCASVKHLVSPRLAEQFLHWFNALGTGPLIRDLRQRAANLQEQELTRWTAKLGTLSPDDRKLVEGILRGYANKLLHEPLVQIREFANDDDGYLRLDTVRRLFNLDDAPGEEET